MTIKTTLMIEKDLKSTLQKPYALEKWQDIFRSIFPRLEFLSPGSHLPLFENIDFVTRAFQFGSIVLSDNRRIALIDVQLTDHKAIARNPVQLREMAAKVIDGYYQGLLVLFHTPNQNDYRLSFISKISAFGEDGELITTRTAPKRFTYVLGPDESCTTAARRLSEVAAGDVTIKSLTEAFSVEKLNEEFYGKVVEFFYRLVGGRIGNSRQAIEFRSELILPSLPIDQNKKTYQEFAVRLIGRLVFCWFLKYKKSSGKIPLISEKILSKHAIRSNYYHSVIEKLFFGLLNTKPEDRRGDLPLDAHLVPFLNGGLFEPQSDDYYTANSYGESLNIGILQIPDAWFEDLFEVLVQYNFTIDENSTNEAEVSIDPEMLGRIFENLLAEIDPESGETARKATGSFYTPREIVDYMVNQALMKYLNQQTSIPEFKLLPLFEENENFLTTQEKSNCLDALHRVRILDPACGSGAFPIGALQKIVRILQNLDPDASLWKERQLATVDNALIKRMMREKLKTASADYIRKLGIIQQSIYGSDIQSIAADISKLRCFLTLIVDENINDATYNRGIEPLPNLEFKFVTANTLKSLATGTSDAYTNKFIIELQQIRAEYLQASGEEKKDLKNRFQRLQKELFQIEISHLGKNADTNKVTTKGLQIAQWEPFSHKCAEWFDAEWMFGISDGFHIIIGNPPYGGTKIPDEVKLTLGLNSRDPYGAFISRFMPLRGRKTHLQDGGILAFIVSDTFMSIKTHHELRRQLVDNTIHQIIRVHPDTFKATVNTAILIAQRSEAAINHECLMADLTQISIHENHDFFVNVINSLSIENPNVNKEQFAFYRYPQRAIKQNSNLPFFVASPKFIQLLNDTTIPTSKILVSKTVDENSNYQKIGHSQIQLFGNEVVKGQLELLQKTTFSNSQISQTIEAREICINGNKIQIIKLGQIAQVPQGISTGDNKYYVRRFESGEGYLMY